MACPNCGNRDPDRHAAWVFYSVKSATFKGWRCLVCRTQYEASPGMIMVEFDWPRPLREVDHREPNQRARDVNP